MNVTNNLRNDPNDSRAASPATPEQEVIAAGDNAEFWSEYSATRHARHEAEAAAADAHHGLLGKWMGKRKDVPQQSATVEVEVQRGESENLDELAEFWSQWAASEGASSPPKTTPRKSVAPETPPAPQPETTPPPVLTLSTVPTERAPRTTSAPQTVAPPAAETFSAPVASASRPAENGPTARTAMETPEKPASSGDSVHAEYWTEWKSKRQTDHSAAKEQALKNMGRVHQRYWVAIVVALCLGAMGGAWMTHGHDAQKKALYHIDGQAIVLPDDLARLQVKKGSHTADDSYLDPPASPAIH